MVPVQRSSSNALISKLKASSKASEALLKETKKAKIVGAKDVKDKKAQSRFVSIVVGVLAVGVDAWDGVLVCGPGGAAGGGHRDLAHRPVRVRQGAPVLDEQLR